MSRKRRDAFTKVELLIILGVVGFLASTQLSRWPETQIYQKRGKARSNMRQMAATIEAQRRQTGSLPATEQWREGTTSSQLPVPAPMDARLTDPFSRGGWLPIAYHAAGDRYALVSVGPDEETSFIPVPGWEADSWWATPQSANIQYDPTNGAKTTGDIIFRSWVPEPDR